LSKIASERTFGILVEEGMDDKRELGLVDDEYREASYVDGRRPEGKEFVEVLGHVNQKRHGDAAEEVGPAKHTRVRPLSYHFS
jgi:hypothetical protein